MRASRPLVICSIVLLWLIVAGPAEAVPSCAGERATVVGDGRSNELDGTRRADVIVARGGGDIIDGKGGADIICAGAGNDQIFGGPGDDRIFAGDGDDVIRGEGDDDRIAGEAGDDRIYGQGGKDRLAGGAGDDALDGGAADDLFDGGTSGVVGDTASWTGAKEGITASLERGEATGWGEDTLKNIDNLAGSRHTDRLFGNDGPNTLLGGDGGDLLVGNGGEDGLLGGRGSDVLDGGPGPDHLDGGPHDKGEQDRIPSLFPFDCATPAACLHSGDIAAFSGQPIVASLVTGEATGQGSDRLKNIESLKGAVDQTNTLIGDERANVLIGGMKADVMIGNGGSDDLLGKGSTSGSDQFYGDGTATTLVGVPGDDRLIGGAGRDLFWPGIGKASIEGGEGTPLDYVSFEHLGSGVTASLEDATFSSGGGTSGSLNDIEQLFGTRHADSLTGNEGANRLEGWEGADTLAGLGGNDYLDGGSVNCDTTPACQGGARDRDAIDGGSGTDECWWGFTNAGCESVHSPDP